MKSELNALMEKKDFAAILVSGPAQHNPAMVYLTGGGHLTHADLIQKRGGEPLLFFQPMERDEAAKSGLATRNLADYRMNDLIKQYGGDLVKAMAARYRQMLVDAGVTSGRVALYGKVDAGRTFAVFQSLQHMERNLAFTGELDDSLLLRAMATKDAAEIARIRRMGQVTTEVVAQVADYLTSCKVMHEVLMASDGGPLTIGAVKQKINLWLAERGAENPEDTIFSIGRDAAVPHSSGTASDVLRLGQTIVFDIYPCEAGGGYFYDFTRTWCLGYAPDEVQALYADVASVFKQITSEMKAGMFCPTLQERVCELFEAQGHPTIRKDPQTENGYVHSLGHGVGLNIHERPWFGSTANDDDRLLPGSVFTVEPGLYYPERGMGVRIEDTYWVRPDGQVEPLVEYPKDLVLPMKAG